MSQCPSVRKVLPLHAGGDLAGRELRRVEAHLETCEACRAESAQYAAVLSQAKRALLPDLGLSEVVRRRIARQAAANRSASPRWNSPLSVLSVVQRPGLAGAVAALVLAVAILPAVVRRGEDRSSGPEISTVQLTSQGGAVRLAWTDGKRESYTVYKGSDPRALEQAEAHVVRGHAWIDSHASASPIVYYRIE